jgi:hypothetical protein
MTEHLKFPMFKYVNWNRCCDFQNIIAEKIGEKMAFLQNTASSWQKRIITLVFKINANFFDENWEKIAENCDHNIDHWLLKNRRQGEIKN